MHCFELSIYGRWSRLIMLIIITAADELLMKHFTFQAVQLNLIGVQFQALDR